MYLMFVNQGLLRALIYKQEKTIRALSRALINKQKNKTKKLNRVLLRA